MRSHAPPTLALFAILFLAACGPEKGTIGAMLAQRNDGQLFVREVPDGLAADEAGLQPGDQILLIDGMDVRGMNSRAIHRALSGDVGDKVKLTVVRGEEVIRVTLKRTKAKRPKPAKPAAS
jgi:carboxyl-terminal processing protease